MNSVTMPIDRTPRRAALVAATLEALAADGMTGATVEHVAARAHVSPGLILDCFGAEDALLSQAFRTLGDRLRRRTLRYLASASTPRERLHALLGAALSPERPEPHDAALWLAFRGAVARSPSLARVQRACDGRMRSNLRHALAGLVPGEAAGDAASTIGLLVDGARVRAAGSGWTAIDHADLLRLVDGLPEPRRLAAPAIHSGAHGDGEVRRNWIGGGPVDGRGPVFETRNPATGALLARVQSAGADEIAAAVRAAKAAQPAWRRTAGAERGRVLRRAAALLRERNDGLAHLETLDTGKPIAETSTVDVLSGADSLEYFAAVAATLEGGQVDLGPGAFGYTRREPLGVVAGIGAWNYPLQIACWKAAPALACGNAMIFKPSELTPLTALALAEIFAEAGLPDGLFNVVQGDGATGRLLTTAPGIAKVSLTGSAATGRRIAADAASTLKQVTLELGGKSPLLVFADADLDNAVSAALLGNFYSSGQVCSNGTRVFVQRAVLPEFLRRLLERTARLRIGDPLDPQTQIGPLIGEAHMREVLSCIERGVAEGATLLAGGARATAGGLERGCYVQPTIFSDCTDGMAIVRDEIFGPVMSVLAFDDEDEAVRRANDTEYGLAAGVMTRDLARAHRVIAELEAGTCWINQYNVTPVELPFGGSKGSGIGRENGQAAIAHYTQVKSVYVSLSDIDAPY